MQEITRFALEKHDGPYEKWPLKSRLIVDGRMTEIQIPGYQLLYQFETPDYYLLITDYDCPYEEMTNFILLDKKDLKIISYRWLGFMYDSFLLKEVHWLNERQFKSIFYQNDLWVFTIRSWGIAYLWPRLKMQHVAISK